MCRKNRTPRCTSCGRRGDCHRRNCTATYQQPPPIQQQALYQQPAYTPQIEPAEAQRDGHDTPPSYEEGAWPAQQDNTSTQHAGGLLGFIMQRYQGRSSGGGDAETVKALEYAFRAGQMEGRGEKM